jgi:hypothetical protein
MGRVSRLKAEREFSFGCVAERYRRLYSGLMENPMPDASLLSTA